MSQSHLSVIGKRLPKVDAMAKCVGETRYADDLNFPRMLYAKLLRSPHPHARIREIRTEKATNLEGVYAVILGKDLPEKFGVLPSTEDEEALAIEKARYVGNPIAAVAAASEAIAEKALKLIDVDYEPLPPIFSIEEALVSEGDKRIHSWNRQANIQRPVSLEFGDVQRGFDQADYIFEDTFFYQGNTHLPMEQYCSAASREPDGKLTVWSSVQIPHHLHVVLSKVLGLPMQRIRVIAMPVGGGFGGKLDPFANEICVAKLSMITGRTVKITLTREECFYVHRGRHPTKMWIKTGVKSDGTLQAMHFKSFLDGGGYSSYGLVSVYYTGALQTMTYKLPAYKFEGVRLFTNKPPCGPKRGHGTPQPRFAVEVQLDEIAEKLGMDPIELRLKQLVEPNTVTVNGFRINTVGLRECIEKAAARAEWKKKFRRLPYGQGIGFAASAYISGAGMSPGGDNEMPHSGVQIKLDRGGGITAFCGSIDIGQGSDSILAYAVAEEFGVDPTDVRVVTADTDLTPVDLGSYSSRVTVMTGNAAIQACQKLKEILLEVASDVLEVPADDLEFAERQVRSRSLPERGISFVECVQKAESRFGTLGSTGSYRPQKHPGNYRGSGVGPSPAYSYSACVVELHCNVETGEIKVDKVWVAHDCGRAFNPMLVEGQVEGSIYMGLGEVLMEEQVFRKSGLHKIPSILDYKSPTTLETPEIETILVETNDPEGPFGAKEAGQGPLLPLIPAVVNALYDAIGVRIHEIPVTPDKVLRALEGRLKPVSIPSYEFPPPIKWQPSEAEC
jgi:4-hydroxybenzoyl-CoA reductase alpha subunit